MKLSIKNNTTIIQDLLEQVNSLPEAESLDTEILTQSTLLSEQDAKIAELAQVLAGKASNSENNFKTAEITIQSPSQTIISVVYTDVENMVPTAKYLYVAGESIVITALQGTSIIVCASSVMDVTTSGAVRTLKRNNDNNMGYILDSKVRCCQVLYDSGNAGLITIR